MTTLPCFQLQVAPPTPGEAGPTATAPPAPTTLTLDFGLARKNQGSFDYDREKGGYSLEWANLAEFDAWRRQEEIAYSIELVVSKRSSGKEFTQKTTYRCSRARTGGEKPYEKKHPDRNRKFDSKKTGCRCQITIKRYSHTPTVLGRYDADHDHKIGLANIAHTRISAAARIEINKMLTQQIDHREIVCKRSQSLIINLINLQIRRIRAWAPDGSRDRFISPQDITRMGRLLANDKICLHPEDAISLQMWADKLRSENARIFHKNKVDPPPPGSSLQQEDFVLCIQTPFQLDAFRRLGDYFIGIDATHNITIYEGLQLFTIIARDRWGHGE